MIQLAGVNPCAPDNVTPYLNTPAVKAALHARQDIQWVECRFEFLHTFAKNHVVIFYLVFCGIKTLHNYFIFLLKISCLFFSKKKIYFF
jgi:hypothetical protein